jgi:valyl-tRNA synthetase
MAEKENNRGSMESILNRPAKDGLVAHYQNLKGYVEALSGFDVIAAEFINALYGEKGMDGSTAIGAIRKYHSKIVSELGKVDEIKKKDPKDSGEYLNAIRKEKEVVGEMLNVALTRTADTKNSLYASISSIEEEIAIRKANSVKLEAEYKELEKKIGDMKKSLEGVESVYKELGKLGKSLTF